MNISLIRIVLCNSFSYVSLCIILCLRALWCLNVLGRNGGSAGAVACHVTATVAARPFRRVA